MSCFEWANGLEIGHAEIDEQHQRLFLLGEVVVQSLAGSGGQKLAAAKLQAFIVLAQEHFKYEEGLLLSAGYPELVQHAKFHASLLTELIMNCDKLHWGRSTDPAGLSSFLWNWLILHIDTADREAVVWLRSQERFPRQP